MIRLNSESKRSVYIFESDALQYVNTHNNNMQILNLDFSFFVVVVIVSFNHFKNPIISYSNEFLRFIRSLCSYSICC